jgi:hypothetical protein
MTRVSAPDWVRKIEPPSNGFGLLVDRRMTSPPFPAVKSVIVSATIGAAPAEAGRNW